MAKRINQIEFQQELNELVERYSEVFSIEPPNYNKVLGVSMRYNPECILCRPEYPLPPEEEEPT